MAEIAEAVMLTDSNADEVSRWINSVVPGSSFSQGDSLFLFWHRGVIPVPVGYWIVRDSNFKIAMCCGDSFRPEWIPDYVEERQ